MNINYFIPKTNSPENNFKHQSYVILKVLAYHALCSIWNAYVNHFGNSLSKIKFCQIWWTK